MSYRSNLPAVLNALEDAVGSGLAAAGDYVGEMIGRELAHGYTSGEHVEDTRANAESVQVQVFIRGEERPYVRIWSNKPHAYFWEVGHYNIFTRSFQRKEIWVPTLYGTANEQVLRFTAAAMRAFEARSV